MKKSILTIEDIKKSFKNNDFEFTQHALKRAFERDIEINEIISAHNSFVIIEDYPDDKYSHSCLILGFRKNGKPIHLQVTREFSFKIKVITLYVPDDALWDVNFIRRKK